MLEYLTNHQGKLSIIYQKHIFIRERVYKDETYWKCRNYHVKLRKCSMRVHARNEEIIKEIGIHNHAADINELESL